MRWASVRPPRLFRLRLPRLNLKLNLKLNLNLKWDRHRRALLLLLAFGVMAVVSGYTRLSETDDELFHVRCGMEWWREGTYATQPLHPPMARVMDSALLHAWERVFGPIAHAPGTSGGYMTRMVLTRLGSLPYYILSCVLVYVWARRLFGGSAALWSLGAYVTLSSVTAHGMLATTDIGYTAMFLWALYAFLLWLEQPGAKRSVWLGASLAFMTGTKFSCLVHWPLAALAVVMAQVTENYRQGRALSPFGFAHIRQGAMIVLPCFLFILWLIYRCDFTPLASGVRDAMRLNRNGFGVWFYGPLAHKAVWNFFPVVFFYKTPLSLLIAAAAGTALTVRGMRRRQMPVAALFPLLAAAMLLLASMTSHINLGVRHVLPLYPLLAIPAGYGLWRLWQGRLFSRLAALALLLWQVAGFCMYHPEHLAYFNVLAGEHPERITLDSDFDWGQSMILLNEALQRRDIRAAHLCVRKDAVWSAQFVVRAKMLPCPREPVSGWIAVSRAWRLLNPDYFTWLTKPDAVEKIGKTMDLYYIAPAPGAKQKPGKPPAAPKGKPMARPEVKPQVQLPPILEPHTPTLPMSIAPRRKPSLKLPQAAP